MKNVVLEARGVDDGVEREHGLAGPKPIELPDFFGTDGGHGAADTKLPGHVREQALMARDDDGGRPLARLDAEQRELHRQEAGITFRVVDEGVDAVDVGVDDGLAVRVVVVELLRHVFSEHVEPCPDVAVELASP